jgi:hypothetical protein
MAVVQSQYTKASRDIHLRDYRHAKNLYYEYGLAFAPKTKFLYHCLFEPSPEIGDTASANSFAFQKEIGVLVKTADLPSFNVSVENKKQYNRIKQFQTRIDYNDVNISFHDDNLGITRAMFEEYYKYYWIDGNHNIQKNALVSGPYATRDKYDATVPKYGLNNNTTGPFFTSITLYQLSRQQYFAYTLVNPIIVQWNHGSVDASDGAGINENTMSIAYEAVQYSKGEIGEDSQPVAFGDPETGYDQTPSPLSEPDLRGRGNQYVSGGPKLINPLERINEGITRKTSTPSATPSFIDQSFGSLNQITTPKTDTKNTQIISTSEEETIYKKYSGSEVKRILTANTSFLTNESRIRARQSFTAKSINSGAIQNIPDMKTFKQLYTTIEDQNLVIDNLIDLAAAGDQKLLGIANESIGKYK